MTFSASFLPVFLILLICLGLIGCVAVLRTARGTRSSEPPFRQRDLLNKGEVRLMKLLERIVPEIGGPTARVCPQVNYGEFLTCSGFSKFLRINSKRADFLVTTNAVHVVLVVELQGSGHFGSTSKSAARVRRADRIKRAALNEAGIPLLEVNGQISAQHLTDQIWALITPARKETPYDIK